ncbi:ATP-binding protein [Streptomyces sp. NPDC003753]|uniref:ATP-binding protein n=1 Tax=unclassified Streptomyces TaxID=2593676 RepID=UPI0019034697|nr:ATP-binding protein [Streptomyces sp. Y2F8-2]GHK00426.1 ATP-binding protein [Streptomyces sp. Y2F8-2]
MNQEIAESTDQLGHAVRNFSVLLSSTPRGARLARLLATEQLRTWGLPLEAPGHVVAELAANAVTHGRVPGRDFRLMLYVVGDTLRIEVTDTRCERLPQLRQPAAGSESGRGLVLVDALADRWGVREDRFPRKTVWAELRCSEPEPTPTGCGGEGDSHPKNSGKK